MSHAVPFSADAHRPVRARYDTEREIAAHAETRDRDGINTLERELIQTFFPQGSRLVDLGAGAGREALPIAELGYDVAAVDIVPGMLRSGRRAASQRGLEIQWVQANVAALPFPDGAFRGALLLAQLLEHFHGRAQRIAVLREAARVVGPGGHLLVSAHNGLWHPGFRRWLFGYAERRATPGCLPNGGVGWRRLVRAQRLIRAEDLHDARRTLCARVDHTVLDVRRRLSGAEPGDGFTQTVSHAGPDEAMPFHPYKPGELAREARAAGLRIVAERPWPEPPQGLLGRCATRGAPFWYAALDVAEAGTDETG